MSSTDAEKQALTATSIVANGTHLTIAFASTDTDSAAC